MGYIRNTCIVVTGGDTETADIARQKLIELCRAKPTYHLVPYESLVSPLIPHVANGGACFLFGVDGSKEGWIPSQVCNEIRDLFITWLAKNSPFLDWVEIQLGGDDQEFVILRSPTDNGL